MRLLNTASFLRSAFSTSCIQLKIPRFFFSTSTLLRQHTETHGETSDSDVEVERVSRQDLPLITSRKLQFPSKLPPKQAWLETLDQTDEDILGLVDLHPEIFGVFPRIDVLWWNVFWQRQYKRVDYAKAKTRAEMRGGGRKPWPQKHTGRARHGSIRSPLWHKGGKSFGPRGPKSHFFMLADNLRVLGLRTALTVKYAQDNLHIIENLDLPSDDPKYLTDVVESKDWGLSVLFVDDTDYINRNMAIATNEIKQYNVMPVYGLNVYSMLKHETLILTLDALEKIEERLLHHMYNVDHRDKHFIIKGVGPRI